MDITDCPSKSAGHGAPSPMTDYGFRVLNIETTNRCNMRCSFCGLPVRKLARRDMTPEDVISIMEQAAAMGGAEYVAFHMFGEPLLYRHLWRCLDEGRRLGLRTQLVTNGLLLTPRNIERILEHQPNILRISLQILDPKIMAATRGIKTPYKTYLGRVADCLARLLDSGHHIEEIRTDLATNDDRYAGLRGNWRKLLDQTGFAIPPGDPTVSGQTPKLMQPYLEQFLGMVAERSKIFELSLEHLAECTRGFYSHPRGSGVWDLAYRLAPNNLVTYKLFWHGRKLEQYQPVDTGLCRNYIMGVLADGTVTCCCNDYGAFTALGNIHEEPLAQVLERNRALLDGLHNKGDLPFEACRRCLGFPTKRAAVYDKVRKKLRG